jgi:hypothetical protein
MNTMETTPFYDAFLDYDIPRMVQAARPVVHTLIIEAISNQLFAFEGGSDLDKAIAGLTGEPQENEPFVSRAASLAVGIAIGQMMPTAFNPGGAR